VWWIRRADGTATVIVRLFAPLSGPEDDAVRQEGMLLARFVALDLAHDIHCCRSRRPGRTAPRDCSGMPAGRSRI